jgi:hypothetical protein
VPPLFFFQLQADTSEKNQQPFVSELYWFPHIHSPWWDSQTCGLKIISYFFIAELNKLLLTSYPDTFFLVAKVPGFQFTHLATIVYLFTSSACRQTHKHRPTTLIAVLEQWLPVNKI